MIDRLVVFLTALWCSRHTHIHTESRHVRLCIDLFEHQKKANALQLCQQSSQSNSLYMRMMPAHTHTHTRIDEQTNKQIRYCRCVLWFFHSIITESDRHSPAAFAERVHYAEHIPVCTLTEWHFLVILDSEASQGRTRLMILDPRCFVYRRTFTSMSKAWEIHLCVYTERVRVSVCVCVQMHNWAEIMFSHQQGRSWWILLNANSNTHGNQIETKEGLHVDLPLDTSTVDCFV